MQHFSKVLGIALAGLSIGYAAALVGEEINADGPALPVSLQYIWDSTEWERPFEHLRTSVNQGSIAREQAPAIWPSAVEPVVLPNGVSTYFAAVAGGGAPDYNEIALEKNVLYFQRSLSTMGFIPSLASLFFANGNDGQQTVRYLDSKGRERFKSPEIPNLTGAASYGNTKGWFKAIAQADRPCPAFFYFTGHGAHNKDNEDNNWLVLWEETFVSVKEMAGWLAPLPADQPFVTMMAQCYSGSFANLIYENGDPQQPVALQTRCGFFATVASRPSVGCTPAVNEADYKDYSSSFFAGLTGRDRLGNPVTSADYNQDGKVSYAEAHAFAKVDEETTDWPVSTAEAWLQRQVAEREVKKILAQPIVDLEATSRSEQRYVIDQLTTQLEFNPKLSYVENQALLPEPEADTVNEAYHMRLKMELANVGAEAIIRSSHDTKSIAVLNQITQCEAGTW